MFLFFVHIGDELGGRREKGLTGTNLAVGWRKEKGTNLAVGGRKG